MAYDIKNVFYLDTELTLETSTGVGKSDTVQLDLSAYIDPIARGRTMGTGLAIYKVHYSISQTSEGYTPVCVVSTALIAMQTTSYISFRLECAQIKLDQATLNQLLRTQTV